MDNTQSSAIKVAISKEQLSALPAAPYTGTIRLIDDVNDIPEAISILRNANVVGFDTETRPNFKKGQANVVSLVQLSTREITFLFRINLTGLHPDLISYLEDPEHLKIGLSIHDDFHNLNKIQEIHPGGFVELQNYVKQFYITDNSLSKIYGILFGQRISKGQRLTNWEAEQLTQAQQTYAALDALACITIYDYLNAGKFNPETSEYLTVETEPMPNTEES